MGREDNCESRRQAIGSSQGSRLPLGIRCFFSGPLSDHLPVYLLNVFKVSSTGDRSMHTRSVPDHSSRCEAATVLLLEEVPQLHTSDLFPTKRIS